MKKFFIGLLSLSLLTALFACQKKVEEEVPTTGGWTEIDEPITDELQAIFDKATEEVTDVTYRAVKLIGTQVVAGTNYRFVASVNTEVPDETTTYKVIMIFEDLEGNCEIVNITDYTGEVIEVPLMGGWTSKDEEITEDLQTIFDQATAELVGASYTAKKLVGTQVVAGTNYKFLADVTTVTENPTTKECYVTIYVDLQGNASIIDVVDVSEK